MWVLNEKFVMVALKILGYPLISHKHKLHLMTFYSQTVAEEVVVNK